MKDEKLLKLGIQIRERRLNLNLSQEELAFRADVHRTYVGMLERGEKNATVLSLYKICKALNITLSELLQKIN